MPLAPLQSVQASTSPTGVARRPEGRPVQRDGAPTRISRPYSAYGAEDLPSGIPAPDPTAPTGIDYPLGALRSTEPPGHITDRNAHRIPPCRASAARQSRTWFPRPLPSRCLPQRPPPEIQTMRRSLKALLPVRGRHPPPGFTPLEGRCSHGLMPLQRNSPPR